MLATLSRPVGRLTTRANSCFFINCTLVAAIGLTFHRHEIYFVPLYSFLKTIYNSAEALESQDKTPLATMGKSGGKAVVYIKAFLIGNPISFIAATIVFTVCGQLIIFLTSPLRRCLTRFRILTFQRLFSSQVRYCSA